MTSQFEIFISSSWHPMLGSVSLPSTVGLPRRKLLLLGTYRPEQDLWLAAAVERLFDSCTCTLIRMEVAEFLDADPLLAAHAAPADEEHAAPPADEEHV